MNNSFIDNETDLRFVIPGNKQRKPAEAAAIVKAWMEDEKELLFSNWKARNEKWTGDDKAKKEELFSRRHPAGSEILMFADEIPEENSEKEGAE